MGKGKARCIGIHGHLHPPALHDTAGQHAGWVRDHVAAAVSPMSRLHDRAHELRYPRSMRGGERNQWGREERDTSGKRETRMGIIKLYRYTFGAIGEEDVQSARW
jgi:hypothetical protein